ncbi:saccharopine dehydrogenase [Aspergillus nomiae NRRL 13137]|uniref:Saccharopine dehydrogenase n=1 Tax=Aspergillus nomiae NRRL (strain ATCC 15546 / NRRL 13137 / CBS 260.88 / M93) TaxID=1509407 RepID=A0A0L1J2Q3_ASPN3|nr:saccharopine dehydrogenase [Aspergillus nomiae NRRL 13137]KNG85713.1 saccharopine dehydrogenase [Aspergillus nomiae NRRL 13137]
MPGQVAGSKVLLLGSGFVTKPTVEVLSKANVHVTVACRTIESAQKLAEGFKNTTAIALDVNDANALDKALEQVDLAISLIPYTFHALVIKSAIRTKKHVVTTSYVSPAMLELDEECKKAGITVMNEIGLDPGIDHLYAVKTIDEVHKEGGKITSFLSYCGGLPAPECSNNPLGYKFSWSSRGVLLALRNAAKFYKDGQEVSVAGPDLMLPPSPTTSTLLRLPQTIIRGTLRYQGFPEMIKVLVDIGFLSDEPADFLNSPIAWKDATKQILGATTATEKDLEWAIASKTSFANNEERNRLIAGLRWIGIFSDEQIIPRGNPLDTLCATLEKKMQYGPKERDMVMLQHKFEIEHKDGSKETRTSTMCEYGEIGGYSAMAKTVGVPCGVAVQLVLDGTINKRGVIAPMTWDICAPLIKTLKEEYGIEMIEKTL